MARATGCLLLLTGLSLLCCESASVSDGGRAAGDSGSPGGDSGLAEDAVSDAARRDASPIPCSGALNAGFSSLANFPLAAKCQTAVQPGVTERTPCDGLIAVEQWTGIDCADFWVFDAATGALEAQGVDCNGVFTCSGAKPGFVFPVACDDPANGGWPGKQQELCPDASSEAGLSDGPQPGDAPVE